jgi:hypothetical protein
MKPAREQLIAQLGADLRPVTKPAGGAAVLALWLLGGGAMSLCALLLAGPFRSGSMQQLAASPRFLLESLLGVVTIVALGVAGLRLAIPTITPLRSRVAWPLVLLAAWLALYAYGFHAPSLPPSMDGKRAHCVLEAAVDGLPALLWGLWLARRWWPLHGAWTGGLLGLSAGAMPALLMQLACMYSPSHIFLFHLLPGLALAAVGALAGAWLLRER